MTNFVPSVTEANVFTTLRSFLLEILDAPVDVLKGQANRVAEPNAPNFVIMTPLNRTRLETNTDTYTDSFPNPGPQTKSVLQPTQFSIQLDVYGPAAGDNAQVISTLLRDEYACAFMKPTCQPLYTSDPHQMPLISGEMQYQQRWRMTAELQANPVVTVPQQFAGTLKVTTFEADAIEEIP